MLPLSDLFPQVIPWIFLVTAIITTFIKPKLSFYLLAISLFIGFIFYAIDLVGISIVSFLLVLSFYAQTPLKTNEIVNSEVNKQKRDRLSKVLISVVVVASIALAAHLLPGFKNLQVFFEVTKSENSIPFNLYLNFDKPLIIFLLLMLIPNILQHRAPIKLPQLETNFTFFCVIALGIVLLFTLATYFSLIDYIVKVPHWWWLFAANNLLLTCVAEEVFFRGFVQGKLSEKFNPFIGLTVASSLFGLAHFSGGISYVVIAVFAGFIYGLVYQRTGKIYFAILTHFLVNMIHLIFFTYPLTLR